MEYKEKTFTIPSLAGISDESIKQHLGLYSGYVKNFNAMSALMPEYAKDMEKNSHAIAELIRRRSFEFGGMRLHEYYFAQLEGGAMPLTPGGALEQAFAQNYMKAEHFVPYFKAIGAIRGPGWAILYRDAIGQQLLAGFSGEQHQGHFVTLPIVLALDVWEHAYLLDYGAAGRGKYIDAFFNNLNWSVVEERFNKLSSWKPQ